MDKKQEQTTFQAGKEIEQKLQIMGCTEQDIQRVMKEYDLSYEEAKAAAAMLGA